MKVEDLNKPQEQQCNINDVSILLPTIEEVANALNKYREKKSNSGYSTNLNGVQDHYKDGINWALNYITKKAQGNKC